jgi:hypothetical protein
MNMIYNFEIFGPKGNFLGVQPVAEDALTDFLTNNWPPLTYRLLCTTDSNWTDEELWVSA